MQERFDRILNGLLPEGEAVLLAVSGGVDSMCMADLFLNSSPGRRFSVAHCNFHLRGEESDADEALVRNWCGERGIIFLKKDFDTLGYAASEGVSVEMAARELRYEWFAEVCRERGFTALAVAHNANDNAETMILNMLRGTGVKGMTGMRRVSPLPGSGASVIRPLLGFPRKDIHHYAVSHRLAWREDRTNADSAYKRNLIRNEIFPLFERLNPSFLSTLNEDMERFSQVQSAADEYVTAVSAEVARFGADGLPVIDHRELVSKRNWEYVLYRLLEPFGFTSSVVADLATTLRVGGTVSGRKFIANEYIAVTSAREIRVVAGRSNGSRKAGHFDRLSDRNSRLSDRNGRFSDRNGRFSDRNGRFSGRNGRLGDGNGRFSDRNSRLSDRKGAVRLVGELVEPHQPVEAASVIVEAPGTYSLKGVNFSVALSGDVSNVRTLPGETKFDTSELPFPFEVREWRSGDWMRPLGMKGRKKLSDLFVDLKFSVLDKEKALVIADKGSRVLALLGHRIDDSVKVTKVTSSVTVLRLI